MSYTSKNGEGPKMFGLEENEKIFQYDLEKDLKKDPKKRKEIMDMVDHEMVGLKNDMKQADPKSKEFEQMGTLIHGYEALKKVLSTIN
ncbi:MAG: DUF5398 family protein [Simkaniaceae bacterium]|nr:DUF5398 family protein [Simkaniaceae bacterium]